MAYTFTPFQKKKTPFDLPTQNLGVGSTLPQTSYTAMTTPKQTPSYTPSGVSPQDAFNQTAQNRQNLITNNLTPKSAFTKVEPSAPTPPPTTNPPPVVPSTPTPMNTFMSETQKIANEQKAREAQKMADNEAYYKKLYGEANASLDNQLPTAQSNLDAYKTAQNTATERLKVAGAEKAQNIKDIWGETQRQGAQTLRESQGRVANKFASLNTGDSFGVGSATQATENVESDFNRVTQQNLQAKGKALAENENLILDAESKATDAIRTETNKLEDLKRQIAYQKSQNNMAMAKQLTDQYYASQDKIDQISNYVSELKYAQATEQANFDREASKLKDAQFTSEFIQTGIPTNAKEREFMVTKNADYQAMFGGGKSSEKQNIIDIVDKISKGDVGSMTGALKTDWIPGSEGALTKNYYDQLKGILSLENRAKLKGSGAISDFESKTLDKAASALGQNLSEDQFRQVLNEVKVAFGGSQTMRVKDLQTGQTGTIPVGEFDPSLYQQI